MGIETEHPKCFAKEEKSVAGYMHAGLPVFCFLFF